MRASLVRHIRCIQVIYTESLIITLSKWEAHGSERYTLVWDCCQVFGQRGRNEQTRFAAEVSWKYAETFAPHRRIIRSYDGEASRWVEITAFAFVNKILLI